MNAAAKALEEMPISPREKIEMALTQLIKGMEAGEDFSFTVLLNAQAGISDATPADAKDIIRKESMVPYGVVERIILAGQADGTIKSTMPKTYR